MVKPQGTNRRKPSESDPGPHLAVDSHSPRHVNVAVDVDSSIDNNRLFNSHLSFHLQRLFSCDSNGGLESDRAVNRADVGLHRTLQPCSDIALDGHWSTDPLNTHRTADLDGLITISSTVAIHRDAGIHR